MALSERLRPWRAIAYCGGDVVGRRWGHGGVWFWGRGLRTCLLVLWCFCALNVGSILCFDGPSDLCEYRLLCTSLVQHLFHCSILCRGGYSVSSSFPLPLFLLKCIESPHTHDAQGGPNQQSAIVPDELLIGGQHALPSRLHASRFTQDLPANG